mmetsp:Transcript_25215/g.58739  ORF Transcript_25215/g.58739 Transcript_25215/m.58739 type:complete len:216 (+) Transcript_25215:444-1091(+)
MSSSSLSLYSCAVDSPLSHPKPMEIRVAAISAKLPCRAFPSRIDNGPNFHASPCVRSKSASALTHAPPPESPSPFSSHKMTARTGLNFAWVCSRLRSTVCASFCSCWAKLPWSADPPMSNTKTMTVPSASRWLAQVGTSLPSSTGLKINFVRVWLHAPALLHADAITSHMQRYSAPVRESPELGPNGEGGAELPLHNNRFAAVLLQTSLATSSAA